MKSKIAEFVDLFEANLRNCSHDRGCEEMVSDYYVGRKCDCWLSKAAKLLKELKKEG